MGTREFGTHAVFRKAAELSKERLSYSDEVVGPRKEPDVKPAAPKKGVGSSKAGKG